MKNLKKNVLVFVLFFGISLVLANENPVVTTTTSDPILVGELKISDIEGFDWYTENYADYNPDLATVKSIGRLVQDKDLSIEIYFGTWCSDSQYGVPRLIKLLKVIDFDMDKVKLVGLDRDKVVPNVDEEKAKKLDIKMAPTFIFYEHRKELNRFVEFARETLEQDVLAIVSGDDYKHSYK